MIASLKGQVDYVGLDRIELVCGGVGWQVFIAGSQVGKFQVGQEVAVFTYHHVAEDKSELYGFLDREDKLVFELLLGVSGIGPKTALAVFGAGSGQKIINAVSEADVAFFKAVKGLGSKGAQRIIVDLKTKVGGLKDLDLASDGYQYEGVKQVLQGLGFRPHEIQKIVPLIPKELTTDEEKIKFALKAIGKHAN